MKTAKNVRPANSIQQKSVRMRVYGKTVCILTDELSSQMQRF